MRRVGRGPEPAGVAGYARQFTQGWVDYFENNVDGRPTDFLWGEFRSTLGSKTSNICWYCERQCDANLESRSLTPTVDHFRPISRFPRLAYEWTNWVFSCHRCNQEKGNKWPTFGFVDPCADAVSDYPENSFDYDLLTGDLVPKGDLPREAQRRAWDTIDELGLNKFDVKIHRMEEVQRFLNDISIQTFSERADFINARMAENIEHLGTLGLLVDQLRQDVRI